MSAESMHSVWARSLSLTHSGHVFMFGFPRCGNTQPALAHNRLCTVITAVFMRVILWSWSVVQILRVDYHIYLHNVNEKQSQGWSGDRFFFCLSFSIMWPLCTEHILGKCFCTIPAWNRWFSYIQEKWKHCNLVWLLIFKPKHNFWFSDFIHTHTHIYIFLAVFWSPVSNMSSIS